MARQVVTVEAGRVEPAPARLRQLQSRRLADYPQLSEVYQDAARLYSRPLLLGPPICDELIELLRHVFTEEEAGVVRHLGMLQAATAAKIAARERRPVEQVRAILERLANQKQVIVSQGRGEGARYRVLPLMPGMFEMALIGQDPANMSPWHRRFAELFERLYETGFALDYPSRVPFVRYLPVGKAIESHPMALPSDKMEVVLDQYRVFAVGNCQCRMSAAVVGQGCGKPVGNCLVMGDWAVQGIGSGVLRQVDRCEALALKREAEENGMVNWMMNVASSRGQNSCSCCGCCCKALRSVNEFNAPRFFAPPHFVPRHATQACQYCGRCAHRCPMGALTVDRAGQQFHWNEVRCVGCGLCAVACGTNAAIRMDAVPDYQLPYPSWFSLLWRGVPGMIRTAWHVWRRRPTP